ncbi:MAG TPA: nuclear transport factor 2 family protein [Gemmataceae bacterium]|nr:nuclear transport factor 2 family protein [Gemmataceae bacterium]
MKRSLVLLLTIACCVPSARAGGEKPEPPVHKELRHLKGQVVEAVKKNDLDALMKLLDDEVVVTFMNGETVRKPAGVRAFFDKMMKGDKAIVASYSPDPTVDQLAEIYGDTAVATGSSKDSYKLTDGRDFAINVRWTAITVKKDGQWRIAAFHASANVFDNPILDIAIRRVVWWAGGIALGVGLLLGVVGTMLLRRPKSAPPALEGKA